MDYKVGDIITTTEGDNVVAEITNIRLDWDDESHIVAYDIKYLHGTCPYDEGINGIINCVSNRFINGLYFGFIKEPHVLKHTMK